MVYGLMWIESLAAALFFVATAVAFDRQRRIKWVATLSVSAAVLLPVLVGVAEVGMSIGLQVIHIQHNWLIYTASWLGALVVGIAAILWIGLRRGSASGWPLGRLGLCFLATFVLHIITLWNADTAVRMKLTALRLEASALALSVAPPHVADRENAALLYEKAFDEIKRLNKTSRGKPDSWYKDFESANYPASDPELHEFLKQRQGVIATIMRAAAMPNCAFDRDYGSGNMIAMPLPELSHLRECARILAANARCKAAGGHLREALENVAAIGGLASHMGAEPILISGLVACAIDELGMKTLEGILTTIVPTEADLAALHRESAVSMHRVLNRCVQGEAAFGLSTFAMFADDNYAEMAMQESQTNVPYLLIVLGRVYLISDDIAAYRGYMDELRQACKVSFNEAHVKMSAREQALATDRGGLLSSLVLPALSRSVESFASAEARERLTEMACAVAAFRARNGRYPAKAEDLVPQFISEIPLDPFDEKPLRFMAKPEGVTIYSIGPNLKDDGGITTKIARDGDIVFHVGVAAPETAKGF